MKLIIFNQTNSKSQKSGEPSIGFGRNGQVRLNKFAVALLDAKAEMKLEIAQDEDTPEDWYIKVSESGDGFILREKIEGELVFNSSTVTKRFLKTFDSLHKGLTVEIAKKPSEGGWYAILTAKL